jgi:hypothetical protein
MTSLATARVVVGVTPGLDDVDAADVDEVDVEVDVVVRTDGAPDRPPPQLDVAQAMSTPAAPRTQDLPNRPVAMPTMLRPPLERRPDLEGRPPAETSIVAHVWPLNSSFES